MKLLRVGDPGNEKVAVVDKKGIHRDISKILKDLNPETINFQNLNKLFFFVSLEKKISFALPTKLT